ncbi:hypothetical protein PR1_57 [Providencia phage vB_PreS_PR1]|uniref:Uncharacterized protein n=1 Tax=Providencia phage vB_PreS_PR1 TaxID=1931407 RepID=A0A1S6KUY1_9CAUD|nr:hypothetical protein FDH30_gp058 [Providencia phage vB_PreS_PR1]AQT25253.1 hypothetical protein PR1_57 [Providencia phage vB_PreS_PR1]
MVTKPIALLEREVEKASEALKAAQEIQLAIRNAVFAALASPGSQYHNCTIPRGIGKTTMLMEAAHAWALQCSKFNNPESETFVPTKDKLVIFAVRNLGEKQNVLATKLGTMDYLSTRVIVTCDTSENPSVLATELVGSKYKEILVIIDEPKDFRPLVNILTLVSTRIHPQNLTTISLSSQHAE